MSVETNIRKRNLLILLGSLAVLALAVLAWWNSQPRIPQDLLGVMRPEPRDLTPFSLLDQHNREFGRERFEGNWSLVFFGYTYCPDICPMTLSTLASVFNQLPQTADRSQAVDVVFVSVDPVRDTPEVLANYMAFFNPAFTGVTGERQAIDDFARQFGAGYVIEPERGPGDYLVSHTSSIFLVDPEMRLVAHFSPPHDHASIASQLRAIRALY